jgi:hypothetical protein
VPHGGRDARFAEEALLHHGRVVPVRDHQLERHPARGQLVDRCVDHAHPTATDQRLNAVAATDDMANRQVGGGARHGVGKCRPAQRPIEQSETSPVASPYTTPTYRHAALQCNGHGPANGSRKTPLRPGKIANSPGTCPAGPARAHPGATMIQAKKAAKNADFRPQRDWQRCRHRWI